MLQGVSGLRRILCLAVLCVYMAGCASTGTDATSADPTKQADSSRAEPADINAIEPDLTRQINGKLGVAGTRVECPDKVSWRVGDSFHCGVTSPGFPPGIAVLELEAEGGDFSWYLTNTCEDQRTAIGTPAPGCIDPDPSRVTDCPFENGRLECPSEPARP